MSHQFNPHFAQPFHTFNPFNQVDQNVRVSQTPQLSNLNPPSSQYAIPPPTPSLASETGSSILPTQPPRPSQPSERTLATPIPASVQSTQVTQVTQPVIAATGRVPPPPPPKSVAPTPESGALQSGTRDGPAAGVVAGAVARVRAQKGKKTGTPAQAQVPEQVQAQAEAPAQAGLPSIPTTLSSIYDLPIPQLEKMIAEVIHEPDFLNLVSLSLSLIPQSFDPLILSSFHCCISYPFNVSDRLL
jgi:hypothetical protein